MGCFEKWVCKVEKVSFYAKIDRNFVQVDANALRVYLCLLKTRETCKLHMRRLANPLYTYVYFKDPSGVSSDCFRWTTKSNGKFVVRALYEFLRGANFRKFPRKIICCSKIPRKVTFFGWTETMAKILMDIISLQEVSLWLTSIVCANVTVRVDHLLFHCKVTYKLWTFVSF